MNQRGCVGDKVVGLGGEQETGRTDRLEKGQGEKRNWEGLREGLRVALNVSSVAASNCEQMFGEHLECLRPRLTRLENSLAAPWCAHMHARKRQATIPKSAVVTGPWLTLATSV